VLHLGYAERDSTLDDTLTGTADTHTDWCDRVPVGPTQSCGRYRSDSKMLNPRSKETAERLYISAIEQ
jgi:hypothetical protein